PHAQELADRGASFVLERRIEPLAHGQCIAHQKLPLVGQQFGQRRDRPDRLVAALEPELAGAPLNQPVEREIPAETQRLARQLCRHAEIVAHCCLISLPLTMDHTRIAHSCNRLKATKSYGYAAHRALRAALSLDHHARNWMTMPPPSSDVAFTPAVKAVQERRGSRGHFAKMEEKMLWGERQ